MSRTLRMPFVIAAVVVSAIVGVLIGTRVPLGDVRLSVEEGVVVLQDETSGFTSFDGKDGTQFGFDVQSIAWSTAGQEGEGGPPPCLREGEKVAAKVGYRWVRLPDGGSRPFPMWLAC